MQAITLNCRGRSLALGQRTAIMGILNVTPDSFSDGGAFLDPEAAIAHGLAMVAAGADTIDIGGESTRPGSAPVAPEEQIRRVVPVIRGLAARTAVPISIDTTSARVAEAALDAGAAIVNDISAGRFDEAMLPLAAQAAAPVVLMHMQREPGTMQAQPQYDDVVAEVKAFLAKRVAAAEAAGIPRRQVIIDPGIGFGKTVEHNLELMRSLERFHELGVALLVGTSRKSFIGKVLGIDDPHERLFGTAATVAWCVLQGVHIIRVHDVRAMAQVVRMAAAIIAPAS